MLFRYDSPFYHDQDNNDIVKRPTTTLVLTYDGFGNVRSPCTKSPISLRAFSALPSKPQHPYSCMLTCKQRNICTPPSPM